MKDNSITNEYVVTYDLGCQPSLSGTDELVIQDERFTYVIFAAIPAKLPVAGHYDSLGMAVVKCQGCHLVRYGYPNDEGIAEHPLYAKGLDKAGGVCEVINSSWQTMLEVQMDASAHRILGEDYYKFYDVPVGGKRDFGFRHFIFQFKERTFECIAENLVLEEIVKITPDKPYRDLAIGVLDRILKG